jgi:hypothetical protein
LKIVDKSEKALNEQVDLLVSKFFIPIVGARVRRLQIVQGRWQMSLYLNALRMAQK